ncbi:DUF418 domain-containing protein [Streptomyces sp. RG38]|uniref:DUF418 domain-containing protein n=2 Tax=Streptomyces tagetis TaxID=2820809 RepID=A0A941B0N2_9ACTN|nr:DUF418 domain-containing protein [Streptomyces sp. RG38]
MAGPYPLTGGGPGAPLADRVVAWLLTALVAGKFSFLFSFLFGYGFALQRRSARQAGVPFAPRHLRRVLGLFGIGLVHAVLLYPGDILTTYAVLALVLYGLRGLSPRAALRLAAGLLAGLAALLLAYGLLTVALTDPATAPTPAPAGGPPGPAAAFATALLYAPHKLAGFLAGLAAAKWSLAERRGRDRQWQRRVVVRWLPVGLAGGAFSACCTAGPLDGRWFLAGRAVSVLTGPALAAAYACGLLLLLDAVGPAAGRVLAAAGRLSLTHYLTQSLVLAWVFTGPGLARYGRVGSAALLLGCLALYAAQLAVSARLAPHVRYGPAEWLLRALTRARRPGRPAPGPDRPEAAPRPAP